MTADALLRAGDLDGAKAALYEIVRARPGDAEARMFLWQLFAVLGEWSKARTQLNALGQLSPEAAMLAVAYGQAIGAEGARVAGLQGSQPIPLHAPQPSWADQLVHAFALEGEGKADEAAAAREAAFDAAPDTPGQLDGRDFAWIADADPRFGPAIEMIVGGRWGLTPCDAIAKIESKGARDLRDLVWYPVEISFKTGHSVAAFIPARYPGSEASADSAVRLARATNWSADGEGLGQRLLALSEGDDVGLLTLRLLTFS